jgi:RNA polymerase sigma-70 factor (ECF subfamily)
VKDTSPTRALPDEELVRLARAGTAAAMDELVSRHYESAYRVAMGILRDGDHAADVAQEAFLKAFRGLKGFRGDAAFRTWLLTIVANEAKGLFRRVGRRKEQDLEIAGPLAADAEDAQGRLEEEEEGARVRRLLERLPEKQRQAVTLRVFEALSFREIGALIDSTEGAARVNYHHGIRRLREMLG